MNENENNFESLRQLMALKKHEVPPPGYFNRFSARVINEIEGQQRMTGTEKMVVTMPWLFRILLRLQGRPALVGSVATGVFVLLAVGLILADRPDELPGIAAGNLTPVNSADALNMPQTFASSDLMTVAGTSNSDQASSAGLAISTNVGLQPVASMFGNANSLVQPASFNGN